MQKARRARKRRIVFPESLEDKVLRACQVIVDENVAEPVLVGDPEAVHDRARQLGLELDAVEVVDMAGSERLDAYAKELYTLRQRRGVTPLTARRLLNEWIEAG